MEKLRKTDSRRVASVAVCRGGKYLFGKRRDNGKWTMPGGHLLPGERSENGAARELLEETGLEPAGNLEKLGAAEVPGRNITVYSFACGADGEPDASADPDKEFGEFKWFDLDDLPPAEEHHVPPDKNVTLKFLRGDELSKSMAPKWKSRDGLTIPKAGTPERLSWNDRFHRKVVEVFAGGDAQRLRPLTIPVNVPTGSNRAVNADRLRLYTRMARAGEELPPVIVRKSGQGYHLIDGNHRQAAAIKAGHTHLHALELLDASVKKSIAATVAAGMMALSQPKMPEPADTTSQRIYKKAWSAEGLHPDLYPIAHLESNFGQNVRHAAHTGGEYHTAVGALGLKPITAHEEYLKSPALQQHFPGLADKNLFMGKLKSEPGFYNAVAGAHWLHLKAIHGSAIRAAYAWRHGTGAARRVDDAKMMQDRYVDAYRKLHSFRLNKSNEEYPGFTEAQRFTPAFRHKETGQIHVTPGFHDPTMLPEHADEPYGIDSDDPEWLYGYEDGFVNGKGVFHNREQAAQAVAHRYPDASERGGLMAEDLPMIQPLKKSEFMPVDPLKTSDSAIDRILALKSRHVQPSDLKAALEDEDPEVRTAAALHPQLTPELIGQTLQGDDQHLKSVVLTRPDLRSEDLQHCLHDPELSHLVLKHPALSETQRLHAAINTELPIEHRQAALANNFGNIAKNIGYVTYPNLGVATAGHDTIAVPADKRDTYLRIQSRNPGAAPVTALGGIYYNSKEIGDIPPERRSVRAFAAAGVTGSSKTLAGNEGHENQHAVFAKLKQKYGRSAVKSLIHQAKASLEPGHQELIDKLFDFPKQRYYKDKPDKWEEESITHLQNYLQDPDFRTAVHNHLGLTPEQGIASQVEARKAWKALVRHGQTITPEHLGVSLRKTEEVIHDWVTDVVITAETLAKGKKDALQMYGADAPGKAEAKQHVDWAYNTMPNENWSLWSVRHHRQKPEDFTAAVKNKIKHYASQSSVPEIANVRFEKHHDLNTGLGMLDAAEKQYHHRLKSQLKLAPRPKTAKKVMDVGDGYAWWDLGKQQCRDEGSAMGHCGNAGSPREGDSILSLRKEHKIGKTKYYEPHLTFIRNGQTIGEMKGRGNEKPAPHYHEKVASLLEHTGLLPVGGGYAPQNNFHVKDLPEALYQRVAARNPGVKFFKTGELSPDTADALVSTGDHRLLYDLAAHPNLPEKNQRQLLADPSYRYATTIAFNANLAPDLQKELLGHPAVQVRQQLASNPGLDPRHHAALAQDRHYAVPEKLALNGKISPEAQDILISNSNRANGYSIDTYNYLASNESLEPRNQLRLAQLANSPDFNHAQGNLIHENLGHQPKLTPEAQEILIASPSHEARRIIAANPSLDPKYHQTLADPQKQIGDTREKLASNPNLDPGAQGMLLTNNHWAGGRAKAELARNPAFKDQKMQEELLRQFSLDDNSVSSRAITNLAYNPSLHPDLQAKLADDDAFRGSLASNPSLLPELQRKLLQRPIGDGGDLRFDLAKNPGVVSDVQDELVQQALKDPYDYAAIQNGLALNPNLKPEHAISMAQHATAYAKEYLAENPSTPIEALNILVKDPESERVRRLATKHPTYQASLQKSEPDYQEPEATLGESHPHDDSMWSEDLPVGDIHDVLGPLQDNSHDHLGHDNILRDAVAAANFLTGRTVSDDTMREYLMAADGDPREAVINAYGLNTPEGRKAMEGIEFIRDVRKSEDFLQNPKSSIALVDRPEVAAAVMKAFQNHGARDINLGGKHSRGTRIVEDFDGNIWLLKPGSGQPSPAAGVTDTATSQSRREAGFSAVADSWGIREVPEVVLLAIDGHEVAAIRMLPPDWVNLVRAGAQDPGLVRRVLEPYRKSGQLHRWAILDWVLGNPDRHGQNILVGPAREGNQVALIDHGSAFAGPDFSPGTDKNSFIAFYLRAWAPPGFHGRHPADQSRDMPVLDEHADAALRAWAHGLSAEALKSVLIKYGIDPQPCLDRLAKVQAGLESENFSRYVNHLWLAGPQKP